MTIHIPVRPAWTCAGCALDWPCPTRREQLRAEYAGSEVSLALYLAACLIDAASDLPRMPAGLLHDRFVGWPLLPGWPRPGTA